jgi:UDP-N-acetylglucosamine 4,6-dehydratase
VFNGKSVFISGGTGSFGRKFANILLERYDLARLVFYSRDELKQFEMQQEVNAPCIRWQLAMCVIASG